MAISISREREKKRATCDKASEWQELYYTMERDVLDVGMLDARQWGGPRMGF